MTACCVLSFVFLSFVPSLSLASSEWDYKDGHKGPLHWGEHFQDCSGDRQSPINLVNSKEVHYHPLKMSHYDKQPSQAHLINNGHTAKLTTQAATPEETPIMEGGGLPAAYKFSQVHFHWGSKDSQGSEHQVDGKSFPMEAHFVHYKATHPNISAALQESAGDSLAALGIFFQISNKTNPGLEQLLSKFTEVKNFGVKIKDAPLFPLSSLWDSGDLSSFYRYEGSLTTPQCNEIVQWTLLKKPVSVTKDQMEAFRSLQDKEKVALVDNFRPVQSLGKREVKSVTTGEDSAAPRLGPGVGLILCLLHSLLPRV